MTRQEFLKNFEKHLKKYGKGKTAEELRYSIQSGMCPLYRCPLPCTNRNAHRCGPTNKCPLGKVWGQQSIYYNKWIRDEKFRDQMIVVIDRIYEKPLHPDPEHKTLIPLNRGTGRWEMTGG